MSQESHTSLRFQNGEVKDFETAMTTYVKQVEYEVELLREMIRNNPAPGDSLLLDQSRKGLKNTEATVAQARTIYRDTVRPAIRQAAQQMRATNNAEMRDFADALERGNYDSLAL